MFRTIPARLRFAVEQTAEATAGGAAATEAATTTAAAETATETTDWQARFEAQQKVNRDLETKLKAAIPKDEAETLRAELAKLQGREAEYAAEQARQQQQREAEAAALGKANERILKAEIRATAAGKLADPQDALRYLDLTDFQVGDDGEVDRAAVAAAIDKLVESKPYLAAQGGSTGTVFSPTTAREGQPQGQIKSRDELAQMTPEQINTARAEGRLNTLLGIKS